MCNFPVLTSHTFSVVSLEDETRSLESAEKQLFYVLAIGRGLICKMGLQAYHW